MPLDMTLSGVSAITDPLQLGESQFPAEDYYSRHSDSDDERQQELSTSQVEKRTAVLHWSTDKVKTWLQENVPFGHNRMQECLRAFQTKGIDGLGFLTLQRTHPACIGMSDFDWLLLKAARKRLLSGCGKLDPLSGGQDLKYNLSTSFWTPPCTPRKGDSEITPPDSPQSFRPRSNSSTGLRHAQESLMLPTPRKLFAFPKLTWTSDTAKDEQIEMLVTEVQSLRGEIVSAEERETTLQAQMHHLDDVLRTAVLAGYLYTRTRWVPLLGEPLIDDNVDVDDWLQRFLVLQGSSIFFYLRATDLRPQGTITLDDIVEVGPLPAQMHYQGDSEHWFSFHITTCHGLRLECSTQLKLQMDSWLTTLGVDFKARDSLQNHECWNGNGVVF